MIISPEPAARKPAIDSSSRNPARLHTRVALRRGARPFESGARRDCHPWRFVGRDGRLARRDPAYEEPGTGAVRSRRAVRLRAGRLRMAYVCENGPTTWELDRWRRANGCLQIRSRRTAAPGRRLTARDFKRPSARSPPRASGLGCEPTPPSSAPCLAHKAGSTGTQAASAAPPAVCPVEALDTDTRARVPPGPGRLNPPSRRAHRAPRLRSPEGLASL